MPTTSLSADVTSMALRGVGDSHSPTPAKAASIMQQQALNALREQQQVTARLPNVHELTDIAELKSALSNASTTLRPDLIRAVWKKLTKNTKDHLPQFAWGAILFRPNEIQDDKKAKSTSCFGQKKKKSAGPKPQRIRDARPEDVRRFPDVPIMRATAIVDCVRFGPNRQSELLHANAVDFENGRRFIASQCPTSKEIPGLWHMISKNRVPLIVDLVASEQYESKELGSQQYSPGSGLDRGTNADLSAACGVTCEKSEKHTLKSEEGNGITCGSAANKLSKKLSKDVTIVLEDLKICNRDGNEHQMQRLHFPIWKDFGAVSPVALRALADTIESLSPDPNRPILVHCRAGVGRTGTLVSFIAARQEINAAIKSGVACSPTLIMNSLLNVIAKGRIDRGPMYVQTADQFKLLVDSLMYEFRADLILEKSTVARGSTVIEDRVRRIHAEARADTAQTRSSKTSLRSAISTAVRETSVGKRFSRKVEISKEAESSRQTMRNLGRSIIRELDPL